MLVPSPVGSVCSAFLLFLRPVDVRGLLPLLLRLHQPLCPRVRLRQLASMLAGVGSLLRCGLRLVVSHGRDCPDAIPCLQTLVGVDAHRTSQAGDIPAFGHPVFRTTAPRRSGFDFQSAPYRWAKRHDHHECSVPAIPPASSRAGLSVSASLFLSASRTWIIALPICEQHTEKTKPLRLCFPRRNRVGIEARKQKLKGFRFRLS